MNAEAERQEEEEKNMDTETETEAEEREKMDEDHPCYFCIQRINGTWPSCMTTRRCEQGYDWGDDWNGNEDEEADYW